MKKSTGWKKGVWVVLMGGLAAGAWAGPGENIHIGNLTLSPFAELSGTYDDNVWLTKNDRKDDIFGDFVGGLAFLNRTDQVKLRGRGWYQFRRYMDIKEKDGDGYGEAVGLTLGNRDFLEFDVNEKFTRLDDYELTPRNVDSLNPASDALMLTEDRTERVRRRLFDLGAMLGRNLTDKIEADLGYGYSSVHYQEGDLFDWYENRLQGEAGYKVTDKSILFLTGAFNAQNSDGLTNNPTAFLLRGGLSHKTSDKTAIKAGAGVQWYEYGGASSEGDDLDATIFSFDLAGTWAATKKLFFEVSGRNGIQPATQYKANVKQVTLASLGAGYNWTDAWRLSLAGSFRQDDYLGRIRVGDELRDKRREHLGARFRVEYRPRAKFYDIYAESSYEDVDDNLEDDYENYFQWRVSVGISLRY